MTTTPSFHMSLGPKNFDGVGLKSLHHEKDHLCEVYVDFDNGLELAVGSIAVLHRVLDGEMWCVYLLNPNGDYLEPGQPMYANNEEALDAASAWLIDWLAEPFNVQMLELEAHDDGNQNKDPS